MELMGVDEDLRRARLGSSLYLLERAGLGGRDGSPQGLQGVVSRIDGKGMTTLRL